LSLNIKYERIFIILLLVSIGFGNLNIEDETMEIILGALIVSVLLFFLCRELFCWYWKINEHLELLNGINNKLSVLIG